MLLEAREATLGVEHPDTLSSVSNLGLVLWNRGTVIYLDWSRFGAFGWSQFALAVDPVI